MRDAIRRIVHTYKFQPEALATALETLFKTTLEKRDRLDAAEVAQRACQHLHPAGTGQAFCKACHEAVVARLTGQDREVTDQDLN